MYRVLHIVMIPKLGGCGGSYGGQVVTLGIHLGKNILQLPLGIIKDEENLEC